MQWGSTEEGEEIKLDGAHTGKAFAALIDGVKKPRFEGRGGSFWNAYNFRV
jgi:1-aminocyclopropane-1-carboxylate deaminase/D-cysteine desulfhydrase-like pyridoxal-dependent ACC family enzyme